MSPRRGNEDTSLILRLLASPKARLAVLAATLALASVAVYLVSGGFSAADVRDAVEAGEIAGGVLVFPALYAALTVLLFPGAVLTAASGVLFGAVLGAALSVIGATAGAVAAFEIGRRVGRRDVERIARGRVGAVDRWLEERGFLAVLYLRLVPVVPFNALNYVAGATAVRRRDYVLGTAIGIVPGAFAYAALGSSLGEPASPEFIGAAAAVLLLAVGAPALDRRLGGRRRRQAAARPQEDEADAPPPRDGDPECRPTRGPAGVAG